MNDRSDAADSWPPLPLEAWKETYATLHMYTQIVGKVRLALAPPVNHWWHVPLYVGSRGLTTSAIPYRRGRFEILFDFLSHALRIETSGGALETLPLRPRTVADFYAEVMAALRSLGIDVSIWRMPVEIPNPVPFDEDRQHASYDADRVQRFWTALLRMTPVFEEFRGLFIGKASPVHFFWGGFDLAASRFSGRRAPERPGADRMTREAYSHEVIRQDSGRAEWSRCLLLRLRGAGAGWLLRLRRASGGGLLPRRSQGIPVALRGSPTQPVSAAGATRIPAEYLRVGSEPRQVGPRRAGAG